PRLAIILVTWKYLLNVLIDRFCIPSILGRHRANSNSFPTRRSSDLSCRICSGVRSEVNSPLSPVSQRAVSRSPAPVLTSARPEGDRKITRLNSSHASISYAVFCLKQKNEV